MHAPAGHLPPNLGDVKRGGGVVSAQDVLDRAAELGCKPTIQGNWVVFKPPLPADLILHASVVSDQIARLLRADK